MPSFSTPQDHHRYITKEGRSRLRTESAPAVSSLHPFPSPPLSAAASPITYIPHDTDPWLERSHHEVLPRSQPMESSTGSVSGLEGSWRLEGEVQRRGKEKEEIWDAREPTVGLEEERKAKAAGGMALDRGNASGSGPVGIAVMASVMDTSKGRDKVLVRDPSLGFLALISVRTPQKCAQYSLRTYLYLLSLAAGVRPLSPWFTSNSKRVRLAVSSLSLTR